MLKNFPSFRYFLNVGIIPRKKLQIYFKQSIRGFTHFYFFHKKSHQSKHSMLKNFPSFMYPLNVETIPSKKLQIYYKKIYN